MGLISSTISDGFKLVVLAVRALLDQQRSFSAVLTRIQTPAPLPSSHPTVSAWQEPAHPFPTLPLPDEVVDVLIIGSGITGTAIAHELLGAPETAGMRIALVDARGVCSGATVRSASSSFAPGSHMRTGQERRARQVRTVRGVRAPAEALRRERLRGHRALPPPAPRRAPPVRTEPRAGGRRAQ
jgi:hypothetical protein